MINLEKINKTISDRSNVFYWQTDGLAGKLGVTSASLQELRNLIGKEGAIGLIIGLTQ